MAPAFAAVILIEHRYGVRWPTVLNQLLQCVLAGIHTGGPLHGVYAADQVEGIDNQ
ncbi:hypothetical protein D3C78_1163560 [compost metagenome]